MASPHQHQHQHALSLAFSSCATVITTAAPIAVPRLPELADSSSATSSPAVTTTANGLAPPSVSPLGPSFHVSAMKAKTTTKSQAGMNGGRWTEQEHQSFLAGLRLYGREWKKVASKIKTRTSAQIRSHAQKYFAKLARDDETRKLGGGGGLVLGPDGAASLYGYMSDDGSSTTAGNLSGDEGGGETDSISTQPLRSQNAAAVSSINPAQPLMSSSSSSSSSMATPSHRALLPVHPFPSPTLGAGSSLFHTPRCNGPSSLLARSASSSCSSSSLPTATTVKKRARPTSPTVDLSPPAASYGHAALKQRRFTAADARDRLPSPEELVETVSPTVRQRVSSLVDAEISALQVLSCYTWLTQQQQQQQQQHHHHHQGDLKVQLQPPPSRHGSSSSSSPSSAAAAGAVFVGTPGGAMSLAMITAAECSPSIF